MIRIPNISAQIIRCLLLVIMVISVANDYSYAQADQEKLVAIDSDVRKEEIQRYFGYEDLFFRYTTLPYDATMNTNEMAIFLDIGFLYLMFLPLLLVFFFLKKQRNQVVFSFLLLFYLLSCFYFSRIIINNGGAYFMPSSIMDGAVFGGSGFIDTLVYNFYKLTVPIFDTIYQLLPSSKSLDVLTYPFVFGMFLLMIYLSFRVEKKRIHRAVLIYLSFGFLFFLLSAGIVWYGFLMLPLSLMMIFYFVEKKESSITPVFKKLVFVFSGIFILMSFTLRVSNIQPNELPERKGKNMLFEFIYNYSIGIHSKNETIDAIYPTFSSALKEINSNNDLVYKVGTSVNIHINNNHERIFADNQLAMYYSLYSRFRGSSQIFPVLKEYGFSYIIVDLNTATIDRTPTKSLTRKFDLLMEHVFNNPQLRLISTDRIIRAQESNGATSNRFGMNGDVVSPGTFAVYKII